MKIQILPLLFFTLNIMPLELTRADDKLPESLPASIDKELRHAIMGTGLRVPKDSILQPLQSSVPDMYAVAIGGFIFHISKDGGFTTRGNRLDMDTPISEQEMIAIRRATVPLIEPDTLLTYPSTTVPAKHTITVFVDATCPHCAVFHQQLPALNRIGITVNYLAFPREGLNTYGHWLTASVWCNANPQQALTDALSGEPIDLESCDDPDPVEQHYAIGESLGIIATPAIIFADGQLHYGELSLEDILQKLPLPSPSAP